MHSLHVLIHNFLGHVDMGLGHADTGGWRQGRAWGGGGAPAHRQLIAGAAAQGAALAQQRRARAAALQIHLPLVHAARRASHHCGLNC